MAFITYYTRGTLFSFIHFASIHIHGAYFMFAYHKRIIPFIYNQSFLVVYLKVQYRCEYGTLW
jgi:hypothetical protein